MLAEAARPKNSKRFSVLRISNSGCSKYLAKKIWTPNFIVLLFFQTLSYPDVWCWGWPPRGSDLSLFGTKPRQKIPSEPRSVKCSFQKDSGKVRATQNQAVNQSAAILFPLSCELNFQGSFFLWTMHENNLASLAVRDVLCSRLARSRKKTETACVE